MASEIERTWVYHYEIQYVEKDPFRIENIKQAYIGQPSRDREVRVREKEFFIKGSDPVETGKAHYLTVKQGSGVHRQENTQRLSQEMFEHIYKESDKKIYKVRHCVALEKNGLTAEIDHFIVPNTHKVLVEVEFRNEEQAESFDSSNLPFSKYMVGEVTDELAYTNRAIAQGTSPITNKRSSSYG